MRFTLKNLGRLEEATIDLSQDLIVLTGPNNTSKTYVAYAIYGFCTKIKENLFPISMGALPPIDDSVASSSFDLAELVRSKIDAILEKLGSSKLMDLANALDAPESFTGRANIIAQLESSEIEQFVSKWRQQEYHMSELIAQPAGMMRIQKSAGSMHVTSGLSGAGSSQVSLHDLLSIFIARTLDDLIFSSISRPYILVAERSAIQLFSREISSRRSELVDTMLKNGPTGESFNTLSRRARRYSLPVRDSLLNANNLAVAKTRISRFASFAERLERDIMQGVILVDENGEMNFHPEGAGTGMSMHLASSSVKALSDLSFYLRHVAERGQFLIIDEPELNLHPDNQRRVAKLLVRIARSGIKVMISTHSDYIIREINNAIMLSADEGGELRKKYGYEEKDTITPDRVGAYLFDAKRATPIEVKPTGIEVETIELEINSLNASSQDIYFTLFHGRES